MIEDALKLTVYLGERDRVGGAFASDALEAIHARHGLRASVLLRGMAGYGARQQLRTDRLLTLSEDLPLVSVAVDTRARVEAALADVRALPFHGLVTLERARLTDGRGAVARLPEGPDDATKLTVYVGRRARAEGRPAVTAILDVLRAAGVSGATALLGVDGVLGGRRHRARLIGRNADVPVMVIAVGPGGRIRAALPELEALLDEPVMTLERIRLCKRDGVRLGEPRHIAATDPSGLGIWQKLMVYAGEQSPGGGGPMHQELLSALRAEGAAGATTLRGVRGYHGDHAPHGDALWQLRRRAPVVTVIVDVPERARRWFELVDALTEQTGLVTSELVPALQTRTPAPGAGGLRLADVE